MHRRKMTRFFAGLLSALLVFTSSGVEQLVYAAEVPQTVEKVAEGESVKDEPLGEDGEEIEGDSAEEEQGEVIEIPENNENADGDSTLTDDTITATEQDADGMIASGVVDESYGHVEWSIDGNGKLLVNGTGDYAEPNKDVAYRAPWNKYAEQIKTGEIILSGCKDTSCMFDSCYNLTSLNLEGFDTSKVTSMCMMFRDCWSLENLDVSGFDTSQVRNMDSMFADCSNLKKLDISKWDTKKVTTMGYMFQGCSNLTSIDARGFDTSQVTYMAGMFLECHELVSLDISNFDTSQVTSMNSMFSECNSLQNLNVSSWNTEKVSDMAFMFEGCSALETLDVSGFNTSKVTSLGWMFSGCVRLEDINVSNFDTSQVTNMQGMFGNASSLLNLDVSNFDTSQVRDMWYMFGGCSEITELDLSNFDTSQVTNMDKMFVDCFYLTKLNLSSFNTSRVTGMKGMFEGCDALITLQTPYNINCVNRLPGETWYRTDGTTVTELPQNLSYSIILGKNYIPTESGDESIKSYSDIKISEDESGILVLDTKTKEPVSGAELQFDGHRAVTGKEGLATVRLGRYDIARDILVKKEGYHTKTVNKPVKRGECTIISLCPDTGAIQILSATFNTGIGEETDVLENTKYLISGSGSSSPLQYTLTVEASGKVERYQLIQNGRILQENETGIFVLNGYCDDEKKKFYISDLEAGYKVYVKAYGKNDNEEPQETGKQGLGIKVSQESSIHNIIEEDEFESDFGKFNVKIPNTVPIFGNSELDFGFKSKLPVRVNVDEDGKVRIALNMGIDSGDFGKWKKAKEDYKNLAKKATQRYGYGMKFNGQPESFGMGFGSVKGDVCGYGEGYISDAMEGRLCVKVGVIVKITGQYDYTQYFFMVVPFYLKFNLTGELDAQGDCNVTIQNGNVSFDGGDFVFNPSIKMGVTGGVGADGVVSLSAGGSVKLEYLYRFDDRYTRVSLGGNVEVKAQFLILEKTLAEMNDTWVIYDSNKEKGVSRQMVNIDYRDFTGATVISNEYLKLREQEGEVSTFAVDSNLESESILNYAYSNASPRLVAVKNDLYLFYLDGVAGRKAQNQTALFYKKSTDNGKTWSKAVRADGGVNETGDYDFDVVVDGTDIYAVWSDAGKVYGDEVLSGDENKNLVQIAKDMDLMLAKIDTKTGKITTRVLETSYADMQPKITVRNGDVSVAWIANDVTSGDNVFSDNNYMELAYTSSTEDYCITESVLKPTEHPINLSIGYLDGKKSIIFEADTDNTSDTQEDRELYSMIIETEAVFAPIKRFTQNDMTDSVPCFAKSNGKDSLFWYQNGNIAYTTDGKTIKYVFEEDAKPLIGQEFSVLQGDSGKVSIVWTTTSAEEDEGIIWYRTDFNGQAWSKPYKAGNLQGSYTCKMNGILKGDIQAVYLGTEKQNSGEKSNIYLLTPVERVDTAIEWNEVNQVVFGQEYPINIKVTNQGNTVVNTLQITSSNGKISDTIGNLALKPGETKEIVWKGPTLPENITDVYECGLTIAAPGETAVSDNKISLSLGRPDLNIDSELQFSGGKSYVEVTLENEGELETDVTVTVYSDEEHQNPVYETTLEGLEGKEVRKTILNISEISNETDTLYFEAIDNSGVEVNTGDNQTLLYIGKGEWKEKAGEEQPKPEAITVEKARTEYEYGENLQTLDITVTLHYNDGNSVQVVGYVTDADEIDMSTIGEKILHVSYDGLTTEVKISVVACNLEKNADIILPYSSSGYTGLAHEPKTIVKANGNILKRDIDYKVSYINNTNAGNAAVCISGIGNYRGRIEAPFEITKAQLVITANSYLLGVGETLPKFDWKVNGLKEADELIRMPEVICEHPQGSVAVEGKYTIEARGADAGSNYDIIYEPGTLTVKQSIDGFVVGDIPDEIYTGSAIKPQPVVMDHGTLLIMNKDYTVTYKNNVKVGTAQIQIKGKGNYTKNMTVEFQIIPKSLEEEGIKVTVADQKYGKTGSKITPKVTVADGKKTLKAGTDYQISFEKTTFEESLKGTELPVTITGKGSYTGTVTVTFHIYDTAASGFVVATVEKQTYTGAPLTPSVTVYASKQDQKNGETLEEGTDYTVFYENNVKVGKGKAVITGLGQYGGSKTVTFTIQKKSLNLDQSDIMTTLDKDSLTYIGSALQPEVTALYGRQTLTEGTDYTVKYANNVNASAVGKKVSTVTVTGKGNFTGSRVLTFDIARKELSLTDSNLTVLVSDAPYTGKTVKPAVTVKDGTRILKAGMDYSITYKNNLEISEADTGTAPTVVFKGAGNYSGNFEKTFRIYESGVNSFVTDSIPAQEYAGEAVEPKPTVYASATAKKNGEALTEGKDYKLSYENNVQAGTAKMIFTGMGKYGGTKSVNFTIQKKNLNTEEVTLILKNPKTALVYTGAALKPEIRVSWNGMELAESVDYTVKYLNNVNAATADAKKAPMITITGKGNFMGSQTLAFTIEPKNLKDSTDITAIVTGAKYNKGKAVNPNMIIKDGDSILKNGTHYTLTCVNNVEVREADAENAPTVIITGKGNYAGELRQTFRIYEKGIDTAVIDKIPNQLYTGTTITPEIKLYASKLDQKEDNPLTEGVDYEVNYPENENIRTGNGTVTITGLGEYGGTKTVKFLIMPKWLKWFL